MDAFEPISCFANEGFGFVVTVANAVIKFVRDLFERCYPIMRTKQGKQLGCKFFIRQNASRFHGSFCCAIAQDAFMHIRTERLAFRQCLQPRILVRLEPERDAVVGLAWHEVLAISKEKPAARNEGGWKSDVMLSGWWRASSGRIAVVEGVIGE
ncbi:hypothetical protein [Ascidiaceihabitans sp.]|uniref:hypothetical protein n=1 Tax=Ascidiaceihabitans sp. TaxID=1872644 RepID=UPI0032975EEE